MIVPAEYNLRDGFADLIAGIVTACIMIPQAMGYALLAGLPPQYGLYGALIPLLVYAFSGSSRVLVVGPVSLASLMVGQSLVQNGFVPGSSTYINAAILLALLVGGIFLLMRLLWAGKLVRYISKPVLQGFITAAVILVIEAQLHHFYIGVDIPDQLSGGTIELLSFLTSQTPLVFGVACFVALCVFRKPLQVFLIYLGCPKGLARVVNKTSPLWVMGTICILVSQGAITPQMAGPLVGELPAGLPIPVLPDFSMQHVSTLFVPAFLIALVLYFESVSIGKTISEARVQAYDSNKELSALGLANICSGFFGGFPVGGSMSRTVVNAAAGAKTQVSNIILSGILALTLLFFTSVLSQIPMVTLAALVIAAVIRLISPTLIAQILCYSKKGAFSFLVIFFAIFTIGIQYGLIIGIVLSILMSVIERESLLIESAAIGDVIADGEQSIAVVQVSGRLNFHNFIHLEPHARGIIEDAGEDKLRHLVIDCSAVPGIDITASFALSRFAFALSWLGIKLHFAGLEPSIMQRLEAAGIRNMFSNHTGFYLSVEEAVADLSS